MCMDTHTILFVSVVFILQEPPNCLEFHTYLTFKIDYLLNHYKKVQKQVPSSS